LLSPPALRLFFFPVVEQLILALKSRWLLMNAPTCHIKKGTRLSKWVEDAAFVVWDEVPMF
jgi:hypothetical protein